MIEEIPCDRKFIYFHGYKIFRDGIVLSKKGHPLKYNLRKRRGGGSDLRVELYRSGKRKHYTLSRLIAASFLGPINGYEINHKDRDPMNCHVDNLERLTPSQNQKHWRDSENK